MHTLDAPFRVGSKERQSNDHARRGRRIGAVLALSEASIQATFSIFLQYVLHGVFAPKDFALVDHFAAEMFSSLAIAPTKKRPAQILPVYELKITLRGRNPAIWRRVQVPGRPI